MTLHDQRDSTEGRPVPPALALFNLRPGEVGSSLLAGLFFFLILFGYFLIRPVREAMGVERGIDELAWLFYATMGTMLIANPIVGWLVGRFDRRIFLPLIYGFFALNLLGFASMLWVAPDAAGVVTGRVFFVWTSVYNLTVTSFFWALMADGFSLERAKRLFPLIAVGGTFGAALGSKFAWRLAEPLTPSGLMVFSAVCLLLASVVAVVLSRRFPGSDGSRSHEGIRRNPFSGMIDVVRSPYLLGVCGYIMLLAIIATFLYFAQARIVSAAGEDTVERVEAFANIDFWTQTTTLVLQFTLTGKLIRWIGIGWTLVILPVLAGAGCIALGIGENTGMTAAQSLVAITILQAGFRAGKYAIARPARETLFTVVSPDEKYKAKNLIDTFVYRAGDAAGASVDVLLAKLGFGLAAMMFLVAPIAATWAALGLYLGYAQARRAAAEATDDDGTAAERGPSEGIRA